MKKYGNNAYFLSLLAGGHYKKGGYTLAKSTFDLFLQAGYPFDEKDFVVLDDVSDPSLKKLMRDNDED